MAEARAKLLEVPTVEIIPARRFPDGHGPALWKDRLKWNPYEAIWLYMWQIENNPPSYLNHGLGVLEHLLGHEPTDAEKAVGAAIMQWFGTNCGHGFIQQALEVAGYQVRYAETEDSLRIRNMQNANIFDKPPVDPVRIKYRGRTIELSYRDAGRVVL